MAGVLTFEPVVRPEDVVDEFIVKPQVQYFERFDALRKAAAEKLLGKGQMEELTNTLSSLVEQMDRRLIMEDHYRKLEAEKQAKEALQLAKKLERKRAMEAKVLEEVVRRNSEAQAIDGLPILPNRSQSVSHGAYNPDIPITTRASAEEVLQAPIQQPSDGTVPPPSPTIKEVLLELVEHTKTKENEYLQSGRASLFRLKLFRGIIRQLLGEPHEVVSVCKEHLESSPLSQLATKHAAFGFEDGGHMKEALSMFQRLLTITEEAEIHGRIGDILYFQREYERAFHHFRMAVALEPRSEVSLRRLENARRFYVARLVRTSLREEDLQGLEAAPPRVSQSDYSLPPASQALVEFFSRWKNDGEPASPIIGGSRDAASTNLITRTRRRVMANPAGTISKARTETRGLASRLNEEVFVVAGDFHFQGREVVPSIPVRLANEFNECSFQYVSSADPSEDVKSYSAVCSGQRVSLYPWLPGHTTREGGAMTDVFGIAIYPNMIASALADGSSWGHTARQAATRAVEGFLAEIVKHRKSLSNTDKAPLSLLHSLASAHNNILRNEGEASEMGTTAFLGGILLPHEKSPGEWTYIAAGVGNCKAFCVSSLSQQIVEITGIEESGQEAGFLGSMGTNGMPDVKNLRLYSHCCRDGDIIILASDGVTDNFNPRYLGISPRDLKLPIENWGDVKPMEVNRAVAPFIVNSIEGKIHQSGVVPTPHRCTFALLNNALETTQKSRNFMEQNPTKKLPDDYSLFPGQLDFATCLSFAVGTFSSLHTSSPDLWDYHVGVEEALASASTKPPCLHPFSENSPISFLVGECKNGIVILCRTLARGILRCMADETQVYLKLHRSKANLMKLAQLTEGFTPLPGYCEITQSVERTVQLPAHIEPSTQSVVQDPSGLYIIRFEYKK